MDIAGSQYAGNNHAHLEALEAPEELCCTKKNSKTENCVVHKDVDASYMWLWIQRGNRKQLYIVICYFPPAYSRFEPHGESPYSPLYANILKFCSMGDIILLGDFNAHTKNEQTTLFDTSEAFYKEVSVRSWTTTTSSRYEWSYGVWQKLSSTG